MRESPSRDLQKALIALAVALRDAGSEETAPPETPQIRCAHNPRGCARSLGIACAHESADCELRALARADSS